MTEKEPLIYEMKELVVLLNRYLKELETGEIDEMAYQQLEVGMFSLRIELRSYFGEDPFANQRIIILEPDV